MKKARHNITDYEWEECKNYFNYRCAYCGIAIEDYEKQYHKDFSKEHVINNGANDLSNCVPACNNCNMSKRDKDFETWYKEQSFYFVGEYWKIKKWLKFDYKKIISPKTIQEIINRPNLLSNKKLKIRKGNLTFADYLIETMKKNGRSKKRVAEIIGLECKKFSYKIKTNSFTAKEILDICEFVQIDMSELKNIFD